MLRALVEFRIRGVKVRSLRIYLPPVYFSHIRRQISPSYSAFLPTTSLLEEKPGQQ